MIEQLKTIREFFNLPVPHSPQDLGEYLVEKSKAVQAATQLEVMVDQEPVVLSRDEQRLRLWQAIQGAAKVGVAHDDKLIVEELRQAGYCIAATPVAQQPQAECAMCGGMGYIDGIGNRCGLCDGMGHQQQKGKNNG